MILDLYIIDTIKTLNMGLWIMNNITSLSVYKNFEDSSNYFNY